MNYRLIYLPTVTTLFQCNTLLEMREHLIFNTDSELMKMAFNKRQILILDYITDREIDLDQLGL